MRHSRICLKVALSALGALIVVEGRALADSDAQGMSRRMRTAIQYYRDGKDAEAMDRFMEILMQGDAAERPMANEYLNKITQRFNPGAAAAAESQPETPPAGSMGRTLFQGRRVVRQKPARKAPSASSEKPSAPALPSAEAPSAPEPESIRAPRENPPSRQVSEPAPEVHENAAAPPEPVTRAAKETPPPEQEPAKEISPEDKERMKREIEAALQKMARSYADRLKTRDIRMLMGDSYRPRAVVIPSHLLFESGVVFTHGANDLLKKLTGLIFSLGGAQITLLPEGAISGDSKVLDMRRAIAVSAQLYAAGIAPSRLRVNLLQSQADVPKELSDARGLTLSFAFNQPRSLKADHADAAVDESGPPISLGVFPESFWAEKGEGAIIEFSAMESAFPPVEWKFQLLRPGREAGEDLSPLQEVSGDRPVFHQIYWNGHKGYFGELLPPGRYEAVLTATDAKGLSRTLHAWIRVRSGNEAPDKVAPPSDDTELRKPARRATSTAKRGKRRATARAAKARPKAGAPSAASAAAETPGAAAQPLGASAQPQDSAAPGAPESPAVGGGTAGGPLAAEAGGAATPPAQPEAGEPGKSESAAQARNSGAQSQGAGARSQGAGAQPLGSGAVSYKIDFGAGTDNISPEGERRLAQVGDTQNFYPMEKLNLVGYSSVDERDAETLAQNRARKVMSLLVQRYNVSPDRLQAQYKVVQSPTHIVEIFITPGKQ